MQGGVESHCENLYPGLVSRGCEVVVFTRKGYVDSHVNEYRGVSLIPLLCPRNKYLEAFIHTFFGIFAAKRVRPDILHIHAIGPSIFVPMARLLGFDVVMTHHGSDYQRKKWGIFAKLVLRFGEALGSIFANEIICISHYIADNVKNRYGRSSFVIPNGLEPPLITDTYDILSKHSLKKGKYVLAVGRFVPEKGLDCLVEAFDKIISSRGSKDREQIVKEGWKLVIVGGADHKDRYSFSLRERVAQCPRIVLAGILSGRPLHELYSHAGLFVLPSYYEGMPIALLEAMGYGLSCIVSDIPANKNLGLPAKRYFRVGDADYLASKILEFILAPMTPAEIQDQRNMVIKNYNWDDIAARTYEVYKKALGK